MSSLKQWTMLNLAIVVMATCARALAADSSSQRTARDLDALAGQPVDLAPWAFSWRADRDVQANPESYFIPRRLQRLDKVYRTAFAALSPQDLKSLYYNMPDLLSPLLPAPKGKLQSALLWTGRLSKYQVELHWPKQIAKLPTPDEIEVRVYPTSFGWFGWTADKQLTHPEISGDRTTWTYKPDQNAKMDWAYNRRVDAATEMVAVFSNNGTSSLDSQAELPTIRVTGPSLGTWKRTDLEIEWGFQPGQEQADFSGSVKPSVAIVGSISPLSGDAGTTIKGLDAWRSRPAEGIAPASRRGIVVSVLYAPDASPGLDSRITFTIGARTFTIRIRDLDSGPMLITREGILIEKVGGKISARQFCADLSAKKLKSVTQMTREHRETASWDELVREVRLWTCPPGTVIPPLPKVEDPPMQVSVTDTGWTGAWRAAAAQLRGKHMWGGLAFEVGRVAHEMDLIGLHDEAEKIYAHFLAAPGAKSDGDYSDGNGALELATSMRHDMGYSHDGTHASTGRLLFALSDRYFLTGDKARFQQNRARLQAAADWIIRQRRDYLKDVQHRNDLFVAGLMPPQMLGDYALPSCDWHWYYCDNAFSLQGLSRFADALRDIDPSAADKYRGEADAFRKDLQRAAKQEADSAPVRLGHDGAYHRFIPRMAYARGLTGPELDAPQFPDCDRFMGCLPLAEPFAALDANDADMVDTADLMEEMGTSPAFVQEQETARKQKGASTEDAWFWTCYTRLPKASHNANVYLLRDDVPNFLRFWMNSYASMVGSDGRFWEAWSLGNFNPCTSPDNGTAGWFMENFRNLLVMEDGQNLWLARATPRAWLAQGKTISVKNAPTYFGAVSYEIVSDVDQGKINATVEMPTRKQPASVVLRFRHPGSVRIKSVTVNGMPTTNFHADKETIELTDFTGKITVTANY